MKFELVKPRPNGPYSLYCFSCNQWVPNTANSEMKKEGCFSHSHSCYNGKCNMRNYEKPGDKHNALVYLVTKGYKRGLVQIVDSPHNDGAVCKIGEYWFYFGGETAEEMTASQYTDNVPEEDIVREIVEVLEDFAKDIDFCEEFDYYISYLAERID